tara:strand:+ start:4855 stop:6879 length:2025 start_codon:yes stop_codon:yes gene_type:complete
MKKTSTPIAILVSSLAMVSTAQAAAQDSDQALTELKKIVVSATRVEQELSEISRVIAVVETTELDAMQAESVAKAVSFQPNIAVAGGPRPSNQTVNIRGLSGNKILQSVDGVRQVFESGHRPSYFLDPALLQSVEVVKGPASSLWGSGALGGVVAQNTISPASLLTATQNFGGFIKVGHNNNNDQTSTTLALAGRSDAVDWLLSSYYRDGNDIELGNGESLDGSAMRDNGGLAKLEWQINDAQSLNFNYRQAEENGNVPSNGSAEFNDTSNFLINRESKSSNFAVDYRLDTASPLLNVQLLIYQNRVEMNEARISDSRSDSTELDVLGLNFKNQSSFDQVSVLYGVDGYRESFDSQRGGSNRPIPPKAETDVWGGFVQLSVPIATVWTIEVGARYDYFATEAKNLGQDRSANDLSPSLALTWRQLDWLAISLRRDKAFRAPSSEELYSSGTHFCMGPGFCNTFVSNPTLESEQADNTELIANITLSDLLGGDTLGITASVFQNQVDNFIEQIVTAPVFFPIPDAGTTTWVNVEDAEIKGYELAAEYQNGLARVKLAYGQSRGVDNSTKEDLSHIPADTIIADLSYGFMQRQITAGFRALKVSEQDRTHYSANENGTTYDAYTSFDLYASWEPNFLKALKLDVAVNNMSNKYYRRAWEELHEAGRELVVAAKYRF